MTLAAVVSPYQPINGLTGLGLNDGGLYIGVDGQDPETNPQTCYWDAAGLIPAAQPIQILGGYPMRLGTPARLYTASTYSIRVRDAQGQQVFYEAHAIANGSIAQSALFDTRAAAIAAIIPGTVNYLLLSGYAAAGDGGDAGYMRIGAAGTYPGSWFQSADGAYWLVLRGERGINARAFGAKADGVSSGTRTFTGTNNAPAIQQAIDYAVYGAKCPIWIPAGIYLIADTLQLSYGSGFRTVNLHGDGKWLRAESAFNGTMLLANFCDRPALAVNGARNTHIRGISVMGQNFRWMEVENLFGPQPAVDDTVVTNCIDPALIATNPNINAQFTPYCAIAIDPYAGTQPATHYPNVTFPAWSGIATQYGKSFSSGVNIEDCWFGGFVAVVAIQPCNADGNGDFIRLLKVVAEKNVYNISAGNTQGRNVSTIDCSFGDFHSGVVNTVHGKQKGQIGLHSVGSDWESCIQLIDIGSASNAGPFLFEGGYSESIWRIGRWGVNASSNCPLTFKGWTFHFSLQNDWRGHPLWMFNSAGATCYSFDTCNFGDFKGVLGVIQSANALGFAFDNCVIDAGAAETLTYRQLAMNFLGGGWMTPPISFDRRPERYSMKSTNIYNIDTGNADQGYLKGYSRSDRAHPICAWHKQARPAKQMDFAIETPSVWDVVSKASASILAASFTGSTLSLTFDIASRTAATLAKKGPLPGDVIWGDQNAYTFFVRSYDPATGIMLAEIQNGYRYVGGVWDGNGGNTGGVLTLETALSLTAGNWYIGNSRVFMPEWYFQGDSTLVSPVITNCGRADGFCTWIDTDSQILVGDCLYIDDLTNRWFDPASGLVVAKDGTARTVTLSGNAQIAIARQEMKFFCRKPPANV